MIYLLCFFNLESTNLSFTSSTLQFKLFDSR